MLLPFYNVVWWRVAGSVLQSGADSFVCADGLGLTFILSRSIFLSFFSFLNKTFEGAEVHETGVAEGEGGGKKAGRTEGRQMTGCV